MDGRRVLALLAFVSASLLYSLGQVHPIHYQYVLRFLYQVECSNCTDQESECFQSMSHCAKLEFHYFSVTVLNHTQNCTARVLLLLLELKQAKGKEDDVHLDACVNGMNDYHFWNYLACSTVTEGGGREAHFISCEPNKILPPDDSSTTTVLPNWAAIVWSIIAVVVVIVMLAACVVTYQCYDHRAERINVERRLSGESARGETGSPRSLSSSSPAQSQPNSLLQWLREKGLVPQNWSRPTARQTPETSVQGSDIDDAARRGRGSYQPIGDSSPTQSHRFSLLQWLRDKGLVPQNWSRPTARTS